MEVKTIKIGKQMYERIQERKKWQKFGDALLDRGDVSIRSLVPVELETTRKRRLEREAEATKTAMPTAIGEWKASWQDRGAKSWEAITGGPIAEGAKGEDNRWVPSTIRNRQRDDTTNLRVTNLPESTTDHDLRDLFKPFGAISRVYVGKDRITGAALGYAFVDFFRKEDAEDAIKVLNGFGYGNLILSVEWAKPKKPQ